MKQYLAALKSVTTIFNSLDCGGAVATPLHLLLARGSVALVCALAGGFVASAVSGERFIGGMLGMAVALGLRLYVSPEAERRIPGLAAKVLAPAKMEASYAQLLSLAVVLFRPFFYLVLLMHHNWLWPVISVLLAEAASTEISNGKSGQYCWMTACVVSVVLGGIASKLFIGQTGMFLFSVVACAVAWMLPSVTQRLQLRIPRELAFFFCEVIILFLGMLGQAI